MAGDKTVNIEFKVGPGPLYQVTVKRKGKPDEIKKDLSRADLQLFLDGARVICELAGDVIDMDIKYKKKGE